jgi:arylamine N-acetyltransferase
MPSAVEALPESLTDAVLAKLGLSGRPEPTLIGLGTVYSAWCRRVPFDNIRKLAHVRRGDPAPLPGDTAADFFESWLRYGCGGTCWAGNGALCELLGSLGFGAERVIATMMAAPDMPPNHGSTLVRFDGREYIVDASILHSEPLPLDDGRPASSARRAWTVTASMRDGRWIISWRPLHNPDGIDCRLEEFDVAAAAFRQRHERSRGWSPFNGELYLRLNRGDTVIGAAFGQRVCFEALGRIAKRPLQGEDRMRFLIEEIGIDEELVRALPPDIPAHE